MIDVPAPALPAAEAARRAASGAAAVWLCAPADGADAGVARDAVACDPVRVVRGGDVDALAEAWAEARAAWAGAPRGVPVAAVCLAYDLGRRFERVPARARDDLGWPDVEARFFDALWVRDAASGTARVWASGEAAARRLLARLEGAAAPAPALELSPFAADEPDARYLTSVRRILDYLAAGDTYQVNLSRRLGARLGGGDALALAAALRAGAAAPHGFWMATDAGGLVGNSPERFLRVDPDGAVETRPIKGTRPRGADAVADAALAASLPADAKEMAEHVMIVDLERNDLGRVCAPGSVVVEDFARVVSLPTVHHLVTTVRGRLRAEVGLAALLRATFPGGSITGAPKIRAMEIIEELEPVRRGPYTGATGWLGAAGDLDLAVAIRTAVVSGARVSLSVGGGIVADSRPEAELAETEAKAAAFRRLCGPGAGAPA